MAKNGFTLIGLMLAMDFIATPAGIAMPDQLRSSPSANERNAISALRDLARMQTQFRTAVHMDEDQDGNGEYGSIGELSGVSRLMRHGVGTKAPLSPPLLPAGFQAIDANGFAKVSGYMFVIFLPNAAPNPVGLPDAAFGGPNVGIDPNQCESFWCAYAWPVTLFTTGNLAFFVNQSGRVLQTDMSCVHYSGPLWTPNYTAAFMNAGMNSPLAYPWFGGSNDGNPWIPVP